MGARAQHGGAALGLGPLLQDQPRLGQPAGAHQHAHGQLGLAADLLAQHAGLGLEALGVLQPAQVEPVLGQQLQQADAGLAVLLAVGQAQGLLQQVLGLAWG